MLKTRTLSGVDPCQLQRSSADKLGCQHSDHADTSQSGAQDSFHSGVGPTAPWKCKQNLGEASPGFHRGPGGLMVLFEKYNTRRSICKSARENSFHPNKEMEQVCAPRPQIKRQMVHRFDSALLFLFLKVFTNNSRQIFVNDCGYHAASVVVQLTPLAAGAGARHLRQTAHAVA